MKKRTPLDPMAWIKQRMPLREDQQRDLGIAYHSKLQAMLRGSGDEEAWNTLSFSLNIAMVLCEQGIAPTYLHTIQLAQKAMVSSRERAQTKGRWAFSGDEARLLMQACTIHDKQLEFATKAKVTHAIQEVHRRVETGETV
jgi:hypothetical protein